jgi:hypothetical protein
MFLNIQCRNIIVILLLIYIIFGLDIKIYRHTNNNQYIINIILKDHYITSKHIYPFLEN